MKKEDNSLLFLVGLLYLGNLFLFATLFMMFFFPKLIEGVNLILAFELIGVIYYLVFALLISHYTPLIRTWVKKNSELFYVIIFSSVYVLTFIITFKFINRTIALQIFGAGLVVLLLNKLIESFNVWRKKIKNKKGK